MLPIEQVLSVQRQLAKSSDDISEISLDLAALGSFKHGSKEGVTLKIIYILQAVKIQQKYRGWKGKERFFENTQSNCKNSGHIAMEAETYWFAGIFGWKRKLEMLNQNLRKQTNMISANKPQTEFAGVEKALARVTSMSIEISKPKHVELPVTIYLACGKKVLVCCIVLCLLQKKGTKHTFHLPGFCSIFFSKLIHGNDIWVTKGCSVSQQD
ncbi:hypothetical protein POTOM_038284 [Populus tomentosa]|uniref:Uncharacterized protein n=1 Tax=Populus tomentosa TaxID=118781 RepID=A0A8X8CKW9_POPTO|nr:hypothetical protein POTOM_038284 [Populus tomentosa]